MSHEPNTDRAQVAALGALSIADCGPSSSTGARVADSLPAGLSADARRVVLARLAYGEVLYGAPLRVGWALASVERIQESADLVSYSVADTTCPPEYRSAAVDFLNRVVAQAIEAERGTK